MNNNANIVIANAAQLERYKAARTLASDARQAYHTLCAWLNDDKSDKAMATVARNGARSFLKDDSKRKVASSLRQHVETIAQRAKAMQAKVDETNVDTFRTGFAIVKHVNDAIRFADLFIAEYKEAKEAAKKAA